MIVADRADNLSRNKHFEKCNLVEKWWRDVYIEWLQKQDMGKQYHRINIICPHPGWLLNKYSFVKYRKQISQNNSITINTGDALLPSLTAIHRKQKSQSGEPSSVPFTTTSKSKLPLRILIVEPEPDLQRLYSIWLASMGFNEAVITASGMDCIEHIQNVRCLQPGKNSAI
jgi:hypothetical protein